MKKQLILVVIIISIARVAEPRRSLGTQINFPDSTIIFHWFIVRVKVTHGLMTRKSALQLPGAL